jgi:protein SCO1/2
MGATSRRRQGQPRGPVAAAARWLTVLPLVLGVVDAGDHRAEAASIGGAFSLVDQYGVARTDADFRGQLVLLYFGYTYCPDLCPTTLLKIAAAVDKVAAEAPSAAERVVPVLITVDPQRDTPEVLREYSAHFHPRLVALGGTPDAVAEVERAYGVFAAPVLTGDSAPYLVDHTSFIYLLGPDGRYREHFEADVTTEELVDALRRHLAPLGQQGG